MHEKKRSARLVEPRVRAYAYTALENKHVLELIWKLSISTHVQLSCSHKMTRTRAVIDFKFESYESGLVDLGCQVPNLNLVPVTALEKY